MTLKKVFSLSLALLLAALAASGVSALDTKPIGWYCTRARENRQPLCDAPLRVIENYNGYYIDKEHGDDSPEKVVYLTFDAGYENGNVERILDTLKEEDVRGAFFILGNLITKNTALVKRMADEGHTVCNHTNRHKDVSGMANIEEFRTEVEALEALYREHTGKEMAKYFRPPEGKFSERSLSFAKELGYKTVFWSFAYADWDNASQPSPEAAMKKILDNIHNGAVLLLHPTSKTNADIMGELISELKAQGYRFGTLDELTA